MLLLHMQIPNLVRTTHVWNQVRSKSKDGSRQTDRQRENFELGDICIHGTNKYTFFGGYVSGTLISNYFVYLTSKKTCIINYHIFYWNNAEFACVIKACQHLPQGQHLTYSPPHSWRSAFDIFTFVFIVICFASGNYMQQCQIEDHSTEIQIKKRHRTLLGKTTVFGYGTWNLLID
jgi:hypothetical protein